MEDWVFDSEDESEGEPMTTQKEPSFVQTFEHVKTPRTSVKPVEHITQAGNLRKDIQKSRGHKHSWTRKACFVCKSLNHLIKDCDYYEKKMVQKPVRNHAMRGNHQHYAKMTHPHTNRHVVPTAVLTSEVVPCTKACSKAYATLQSHYDILTIDLRKSNKIVLEYVKARDNALVELRKKFKKAKKEKNELKLTLENFQTSSKNLSKLLASQITDKNGLGYDNKVFNSTVFDYDKLISSESDVSMPTSPVHDRPSAPIIKDWVSDSEDESEGEPMPTQKAPSFVQTTKHVKTPRTSVKPVEHPITAENLRKDTSNSRENGSKACISARMTHPHSKKHVVPTAVLTRSRLVPLNAARPVTTAVSQANVKHQRPAKYVVNKPHSPIRRPINHRPSPKPSNFHQQFTTVKAK
nr:hypothetical protein [Tanacetum cinerariifolium]